MHAFVFITNNDERILFRRSVIFLAHCFCSSSNDQYVTALHLPIDRISSYQVLKTDGLAACNYLNTTHSTMIKTEKHG